MGKYVMKKALDLVGRDIREPGDTMYHAADGLSGGGRFNKNKRHKIRLALHKMRLRASGMSDDILGSKEVGGRFENKFEKSPSE